MTTRHEEGLFSAFSWEILPAFAHLGFQKYLKKVQLHICIPFNAWNAGATKAMASLRIENKPRKYS